MFTGRQWDSETGLYYYRFRDYSPDLGRFLQPDPIGYADSMNLYAYCGNNPINWLDPWGLEKGDGYTGNFWTDFGNALWNERGAVGEAALDGAAAWADGAIPFADPFADTYNADEMGFSRAMGHVSRDALLAAGGMKASGWNLKAGIHSPHHGQGWHFQANWWKSGVKGSGGRWSFP